MSHGYEWSRISFRSNFIWLNHSLLIIDWFSKASYLYSVLCHKHHDEEQSKDQWIEIWFKPVAHALDTSTPLHRSLIAEVNLSKVFSLHWTHEYSSSIFYRKSSKVIQNISKIFKRSQVETNLRMNRMNFILFCSSQ